jgi:hypothetical protein
MFMDVRWVGFHPLLSCCSLKARWFTLAAFVGDHASDSLGHLGQCDIGRIISICVVPPKVPITLSANILSVTPSKYSVISILKTFSLF